MLLLITYIDKTGAEVVKSIQASIDDKTPVDDILNGCYSEILKHDHILKSQLRPNSFASDIFQVKSLCTITNIVNIGKLKPQ
jgi:hypothetical protein